MKHLLQILGRYSDDDVLSLLSRPVGAERASGTQITVAELRAWSKVPDGDLWLSVNTMRPKAHGKGFEDDVHRVMGLYADLDVKDGGMPSEEACGAVVDTLTAMLGAEPLYVVSSGHGCQPVWAVADGTVEQWLAQKDRWSALVKTVAAGHGGNADAVFNLDRVLRVPGSVNHKAEPVQTGLDWRGGAPLTLAQMTQALDLYSPPSVRPDAQPATAAPRPTETCEYARKMVAGWAEDNPSARHPWVVAQATRIESACILGCFTEKDEFAARAALVTRFTQLTRGEKRETAESEMSRVWPFARGRAALKSHEDLLNELGGEDHVHQLPEPARKVTLTRASSIVPRPTTWVWDKRLPCGSLSLIAGAEGTGKSTVAYWIVARITRGLLPGVFRGNPRAVLVAATEDSWERTIVPRLIAAEADLDLVYRVDVVTALGTGGYLTLPKDIPDLAIHVEGASAGLLLLDPIISRLDSALDSHRDAETRQALEPIAALADQHGLSVLGLIHFNKSRTANVLDTVMASKAFTAVARSVSTVIRDPQDDTGARRIFGTPKSNLGPDDMPLMPFQLHGHTFTNTYGEAITTSRVGWLAEVTGSMEEVLRQSREDHRERTIVAEVSEWLAAWLDEQGGKAPRRRIVDEGKLEGYSDDQLKRAKNRLGLHHRRHGFPSSTWWMTEEAGHRLDAETPADSRGVVGASIPGDTPAALTAPTRGDAEESSSFSQSAQPEQSAQREQSECTGREDPDSDPTGAAVVATAAPSTGGQGGGGGGAPAPPSQIISLTEAEAVDAVGGEAFLAMLTDGTVRVDDEGRVEACT